MKQKLLIAFSTIIVLFLAGVYLLAKPESAHLENYAVILRTNSSASELENVCNVSPIPTSILSVYQLSQISPDQHQCLTTLDTVLSIEKSHLTFAAGIPNDPDWLAQHALEQIEAPDAWDATTGDTNIIAAVIDSGVDFAHPDITGVLLPGHDFVNGDSTPQDDNGHGTHAAGIIAAQHNSQGVAGVSPQVRILPIKVLDANGIGTILNSAMAIRYAADNGADVINISYSSQFESEIERDAINYALSQGIVIVAASGDDGLNSLGYPAAFPGVISVGAIDPDYQHAPYSNRSALLDLTAPGTGIYSTCLEETQNSPYCVWSGTSMSAAHVSGLVVLLKSAFPNISASDILDQIKFFSTDIGIEGYDSWFGAGLINLTASIQKTLPKPVYGIFDSASGETSSSWITLSDPIPLTFGGGNEIQLNVPFDFHFGKNETIYPNIYIHKNGFISLSSQVLIDDGANLPSDKTDFEAIQPFWDNLNLGAGSSAAYQTVSTAEMTALIIEWNNMEVWNNAGEAAGSISFQVQIRDQKTNPAAPNNDIIFSYRTPSGTNGSGQSATIGLALGSSEGTQYCVNAPEGCITDNQSLHFYHLAPPGTAQLNEIDELIFNSSPAFTWDAVPFADHYRLYISNSNGTYWNNWHIGTEICTSGLCAITLENPLPDSQYHWWIQTSGNYGRGPWSVRDSFKLITPPAKPELTAPSGDITSVRPDFNWVREVNADDYRIQINDNNGSLINLWLSASDTCTDSVCSFTPGFDFNPGSHSWWVQGRNQAGEGLTSNETQFNILSVPAAPIPTSPSGSTADLTPEFMWSLSAGASDYKIEIYQDSSLIHSQEIAASTACSGTSCSYTLTAALSQGSFSWRTAAGNLAGWSDWSSSMAFSINSLPARPIQIEPSGTILINRPTLKWEPVENAVDYRVYISNSSGVILNSWEPAAALCTAECAYTLGFDLPDDRHHWLLQARNSYGGGEWSEGLRFTVNTAPQAPELLSPISNTSEIFPVFRWTAVEGIDKYRFYLMNGSGTMENFWLSASAVCGDLECSYQLDYPLPNRYYTWYIQSKSGSVPGNWSTRGRFPVVAKADVPTIISPKNSIENGLVSLVWTDEFNVKYYHIYFSGPDGNIISQYFSQITYCSDGTCSYSVPDQLNHGSYFWYVRSRNWAGHSAWSDIAKFEIQDIPGQAQLTAPNDIVSDLPAALTWDAVSGSTQYKVNVFSENGTVINSWFSASFLCTGTTCSYALDSILPGEYTWIIQTQNAFGDGQWSEEMIFTYQP